MVDVRDIIQQAADAHGVPADTLLTIARIESNFDPNASNPSGAAGLFQLMPTTATEQGVSDPYDAQANANAAARITAQNTRSLTRTLGRAPTTGELYLAHQQGLAGARAILGHPDETAVEALSRAYGGSTARATAAIRQNGGDPNAPASQFASMWTARVDHAAGLLPPSNVPGVATATADTTAEGLANRSVHTVPIDPRTGMPATTGGMSPTERDEAAALASAKTRLATARTNAPVPRTMSPTLAASRAPVAPQPQTISPALNATRSAQVAPATPPAQQGSGHINPRSGAEYTQAQWSQVQANQQHSATSIGTTGQAKTDPMLGRLVSGAIGNIANNAVDATKQAATGAASAVGSSVGNFLGSVGSMFSPKPAAPLSFVDSAKNYLQQHPAANSQAALTPTYETVQVANPDYLAWINASKSPFSNPGVQGLSPDERQQINDAARAAAAKRAAPPQTITVRRLVTPAARPAALAPIPAANTNLPALRNNYLAANGGTVTQGANGSLNSLTQQSDPWRMMTGQGGGGGYSNGSLV